MTAAAEALRAELLAAGWTAESRPTLTPDDELLYAQERADYEDCR